MPNNKSDTKRTNILLFFSILTRHQSHSIIEEGKKWQSKRVPCSYVFLLSPPLTGGLSHLFIQITTRKLLWNLYLLLLAPKHTYEQQQKTLCYYFLDFLIDCWWVPIVYTKNNSACCNFIINFIFIFFGFVVVASLYYIV